VNPGSVGYPRTDGNVCESTYVLFDDAERTVTFRRIPFTVRSVMQTGRNPKRMKKRVITAIACAAAIASGAAAWMLAPEERVETVTEVFTNSVTKVVEKTVTEVVAIAKVDRTECLLISPASKKAKVEVKLAKNSPAAQLQLTFKDAAGKIIWEERGTAKKSKKATVKVPQGAASETLSAGRVSGDTPASFDAFRLYLKQ
jgi:predicted SpoU family rRNA methylase